jgi:hypothetical protein
LIILLLVSIDEAEQFLHSREAGFVAEGAAIAYTFNVADRLRSRICLPILAAPFHNVNRHTYTIGHPGDFAEGPDGAHFR